MFELIKQLAELSGPSAQEGPVLDHVATLWRDAGLTTERTRTGNLLGRISGTGPRLLLVAHADELCYLVRAIDNHGFLRLANGQSWTRTLHVRDWLTVGQRVRILARHGEVPGVIATVTGHVATLRLPEARELDWDDLWVETGLTRDELLSRGITPGTRIIWDAPCERLGRLVVGKALDDRAGVAILCELAHRLGDRPSGAAVTLACTVQEEIGVVGAAALAAREPFDAAIVVESGLAGDVPKVGVEVFPLRVGGGPILVHKDSMVHYDHALTAQIEHAAATAGIVVQHAVFGSYGTDGSAFMRADVPTALLAFPTRYTHTPFEAASLEDITAIADLLEALLRDGLPGA